VLDAIYAGAVSEIWGGTDVSGRLVGTRTPDLHRVNSDNDVPGNEQE